ncbi:MAG: hypothetical protein H6Q18_47 [Bacteroidetes bacterium]|nr:hypothetical protein [Bacteroidota bacterium]
MNTLESIQARIKQSRLYYGKNNGITRLYLPYGRNGGGIKTSAWLEVVNDRIQVFCKVENDRHPNYYDDVAAGNYKADIERQFHEILNDCELERRKVPLHERLKDDIIPVYDDRTVKHQADALRFLCSMKVSALFGDVGTQKSKISIDLCVSRYEAGQIRKVLVFLPVTTKSNFQEQIDTWCNCSGLEWKLVGEESMGSSAKIFFETLRYVDSETQIIVDESHVVKNPIAKRSKRIKMVADKTSYKIVMTGTPVTENVHNLYMQYAILSDLIIGVGNWLKFEEKYLIVGGRSGTEVIGYKNLDHLMGLIEPYTYQIDASVLKLPAKHQRELTCYLNEEQERRYLNEKENLLDLIQKENIRATDIFRIFTRMQQITSGYYVDDDGFNHLIGTEKLLLLKSVDLHKKTVFFCKYLIEVDILVKELGAENCAIFTGKNRKERDKEKNAFVEGDKKYFVSTMQSGGTGLNGLQTVSNTVVFFSQSFSYFRMRQSIGRVDRPGQKEEMNILFFKTSAKIDDRIISCISRKRNLADEIKELINNKTKLKEYVQGL